MKASAVIIALLLPLVLFTQQTLVETNKTSNHKQHKHEEELTRTRNISSRNIV